MISKPSSSSAYVTCAAHCGDRTNVHNTKTSRLCRNRVRNGQRYCHVHAQREIQRDASNETTTQGSQSGDLVCANVVYEVAIGSCRVFGPSLYRLYPSPITLFEIRDELIPNPTTLLEMRYYLYALFLQQTGRKKPRTRPSLGASHVKSDLQYNKRNRELISLSVKPVLAPIRAWNMSDMTDMSGLFAPFSSLRIAGYTYNMHSTFGTWLSRLDPDLSKWDVSKVTHMNRMFANMICYRGRGLSRWDVSNVESMEYMFDAATSMDADLSQWNVHRVKHMNGMFRGASSFQGRGLSQWDVSNVTDMSGMFEGATSFCQDLIKWNTRDKELAGLGNSFDAAEKEWQHNVRSNDM